MTYSRHSVGLPLDCKSMIIDISWELSSSNWKRKETNDREENRLINTNLLNCWFLLLLRHWSHLLLRIHVWNHAQITEIRIKKQEVQKKERHELFTNGFFLMKKKKNEIRQNWSILLRNSFIKYFLRYFNYLNRDIDVAGLTNKIIFLIDKQTTTQCSHRLIK